MPSGQRALCAGCTIYPHSPDIVPSAIDAWKAGRVRGGFLLAGPRRSGGDRGGGAGSKRSATDCGGSEDGGGDGGGGGDGTAGGAGGAKGRRVVRSRAGTSGGRGVMMAT